MDSASQWDWGLSQPFALGMWLMALVFISSQHGYDEIGRRDGGEEPAASKQD
jgi:hypothetical protein